MHVITRRALVDFARRHPQAEAPLDFWYRAARRSPWRSIAEVRRVFPSADSVGACTVFNIGGNDFRLVTKIYYADQVVLVRAVLTHAEYSKEGWKSDCTSR